MFLCFLDRYIWIAYGSNLYTPAGGPYSVVNVSTVTAVDANIVVPRLLSPVSLSLLFLSLSLTFL